MKRQKPNPGVILQTLQEADHLDYQSMLSLRQLGARFVRLLPDDERAKYFTARLLHAVWAPEASAPVPRGDYSSSQWDEHVNNHTLVAAIRRARAFCITHGTMRLVNTGNTRETYRVNYDGSVERYTPSGWKSYINIPEPGEQLPACDCNRCPTVRR